MGKARFGGLKKPANRGQNNELAIGQSDEFIPDEKSEMWGCSLFQMGKPGIRKLRLI